MAANPLPPIIPPQPDNVPERMRALRRWAPWRAEWNEKKQKWTKIPHRASRPEYGLSNKNATGWVTFDEAMAVYEANRAPNSLRLPDGKPFALAGVGYLMTGPHGIVGVDLDNCRDPATGKLDDWALAVVTDLHSYTEVSPSGTGLHVMVAGSVPEDWTNHERGIEVYGGNEARFLCITGQPALATGATLAQRPAATFERLAGTYRKAVSKAEVEDLHLPGLLPVDLLPGLDELDLPPHARNFLTEGPAPGDRSAQLFAAAIALAQAGLAPDEVLSILEDNQYAMEVALDHRRQDYDKALRYLWKQCQQGQSRAEDFKREVFDEFDDLEPGPVAPPEPAAAVTETAADDFDDLTMGEDAQVATPEPTGKPAKVKRHRFAPESAGQFLKRAAPQWIIKGVLPRAGLAVIYGASSSGKTFFTLDMVGAVARGVDWRGARVNKGRVLYVVAEGAGGFRNRLHAYCEFHGVDPDDLDIMFMRQAPNLLTKDDIREFLEQVVACGRFDLIVIDTYARAMAGGNENDAKDVGQAVAHCDVISRKTGAMVILVHHSGKDATKGARGSGALRAAADLEIEVVQTREYRAATVTKQKDGADGAEYQFKLNDVTLGVDDDGDAITSCVVHHSDTPVHPTERKEMPEGTNEKLIMRYMETADGEVKRADLIDNTYELLDHDPTPGQKDRRKERVGRALKSLTRKNLLEEDGLFVRLK